MNACLAGLLYPTVSENFSVGHIQKQTSHPQDHYFLYYICGYQNTDKQVFKYSKTDIQNPKQELVSVFSYILITYLHH